MLKNISKLIIIFLCTLLINTSYVGNVYAQDHTPNKKLIKKLKEEINELGAKPVKKKSIFSREQKWIDQLEAQLEKLKNGANQHKSDIHHIPKNSYLDLKNLKLFDNF